MVSSKGVGEGTLRLLRTKSSKKALCGLSNMNYGENKLVNAGKKKAKIENHELNL